MTVKSYTLGNGEAMKKEFAEKYYNPKQCVVCPKCKRCIPFTKAMKYCNWCGVKLDYSELKGGE